MKEKETRFIVKGKEPVKNEFRNCRRMIIGPWVNQPEYYEGYNGFVGWSGLCSLRSGKWLMTFSSGYWHASLPLSYEILNDPQSRELFDSWHKIGMPFILAPHGGRAHIMHSDDQGRTWTKPELFKDSDDDDRSPTIMEAADGTLLYTYFTGRFPNIYNSYHMHSTDGGITWSGPEAFPSESIGGFSNGPAMQLRNGRILCAASGGYSQKAGGEKREILNICASEDNGRSFYLLSSLLDIVGNEGFGESTICELDDGSLIMISRRMGPIFRSYDKGATWSDPVLFGIDIFDPHFMLFPNGVLACFHGSYKGGGLRAILSKDSGYTWHGPGEGIGYAVDPTVYGYCHGTMQSDGSAYLTYLHTGGHDAHDARTEAIWGIRVRPHDDACGLDILPAPGSPRDLGKEFCEMDGIRFHGGDPILGNLL